MGLSESGFAHRANWKVMGWEKAACLVLGDSPLQALGFTVNLVHLWPIQGCLPQRESQSRAGESEGDTEGFVGSSALTSAQPCPLPQTPGPPAGSPRDPAFPGTAALVTLFVNTHETRT